VFEKKFIIFRGCYEGGAKIRAENIDIEKCFKVMESRIERQVLHVARMVADKINAYKSLVGKLWE
jgi:hypothetical protein